MEEAKVAAGGGATDVDGVVAAIAVADIGALDRHTCDALGPGDLGGQRVSAEGNARHDAGVDHELPVAAAGRLVVANEPLTPNSKRVRALPLPMHSISGACSA